MPRLVLGVQPQQLGDDLGVHVVSLLRGRVLGEPLPLADRGVRVQYLALLVVGQLVDQRACADERVGLRGEPLDERRAPLEQLRQLLRVQLPR